MIKPAAFALALAVIAGAAGCVSGPAAYAPAVGAGPGYAETMMQPGRYRVSFRGNSKTPDSAVKQMLFYRAAELTLAQGYDAFEVTGQSAGVAGGEAVKGDPAFSPTLSRAYAHNIFGYVSSLEWSVSGPRAQSQHYEAGIEIVMRRAGGGGNAGNLQCERGYFGPEAGDSGGLGLVQSFAVQVCLPI